MENVWTTKYQTSYLTGCAYVSKLFMKMTSSNFKTVPRQVNGYNMYTPLYGVSTLLRMFEKIKQTGGSDSLLAEQISLLLECSPREWAEKLVFCFLLLFRFFRVYLFSSKLLVPIGQLLITHPVVSRNIVVYCTKLF